MPGRALNLLNVKRTAGVPVAGQVMTLKGASFAAAWTVSKRMRNVMRKQRDEKVEDLITE
jgi:hypothetical protein